MAHHARVIAYAGGRGRNPPFSGKHRGQVTRQTPHQKSNDYARQQEHVSGRESAARLGWWRREEPLVSTAPGVCGGCLCGHSPAARSHVEAVQAASSMDDGACNGLGLIHGRSVI